ncbi:mobile element protein [Microcystis sp. 0824]|nr:mobile element protein [Microcystis sp. 0824]
MLFLKGKSPLKLGITSDFITQSKLLGGSTPQTPERISFSVGCLQAAADTFVII